MADFPKRENDYHQSGLQFVNTELDTGLTFARIALGSKTRAKIERNRVNARKAYNSALHFLAETSLNAEESRRVKEKFAALKSNLERLGEKF
ncbi:MAG TPA: hypothetical protein VFY05_14340 [Candidatus Angelobacter sp.]|nr:hypothetical protein [Candidatus Angelobacter sp.]